jgi:predicted RNase H-like HicB family nuclease
MIKVLKEDGWTLIRQRETQRERRLSSGDAQQHSKAGGTEMSSPRRYLVVIEKGTRNYSAYSPDIPGCIATGRTRAQTARRIRQAIRFHLDGLRRHGLSLPVPSSSAEVIEVPA